MFSRVHLRKRMARLYFWVFRSVFNDSHVSCTFSLNVLHSHVRITFSTSYWCARLRLHDHIINLPSNLIHKCCWASRWVLSVGFDFWSLTAASVYKTVARMIQMFVMDVCKWTWSLLLPNKSEVYQCLLNCYSDSQMLCKRKFFCVVWECFRNHHKCYQFAGSYSHLLSRYVLCTKMYPPKLFWCYLNQYFLHFGEWCVYSRK